MISYLARGMIVFLLGLVMVGSPGVRAQEAMGGPVVSPDRYTDGQVDDRTAITGMIKVYFKQYAEAIRLKSLSLVDFTIEGDRAYAVGLATELWPGGKGLGPFTIGFTLERIKGSQWSIQPASRAISIQEINLAVPFTSQVPPGDWVKSTNCGQTSAAMLFAYYGFYSHSPADPTDIMAIDKWLAQAYNDQRFLDLNGYYTTTDRIAYLARNYAHYAYSYADENQDWTVDRIKHEIVAGRPVIVATYTNMDMVKSVEHLMVVRGVRLDASGNVTQVIVNDPGRSLASGRGENYVYDVATFETAWARNNKAIVVITPSATPLEVFR